jgi:galactonate dehydratase
VARELSLLGVVWFEDPTEPTDDLAGLERIRAAVDLPLVTGERLFGRSAFWPLLQAGVVGTIMPDVKHCGGLWEGKKLAALAEAARVMVSPHNPSGPVATLASAHLAATLPNFSRLEYAWGEVPWRPVLTNPPETIANGELAIPQTPGLGATLDRAVLEEHAVNLAAT